MVSQFKQLLLHTIMALGFAVAGTNNLTHEFEAFKKKFQKNYVSFPGEDAARFHCFTVWGLCKIKIEIFLHPRKPIFEVYVNSIGLTNSYLIDS